MCAVFHPFRRPAAFVWSHSEIKTPNTWNTKDNKKSRTFAVSRSAGEKLCKLRTSSQSSKEPVAGDIEMEQVAFPKFSSATLNFHVRGKLSEMINEASPNSLIQISPSDMFAIWRPSLIRVKQMMGSHFAATNWWHELFWGTFWLDPASVPRDGAYVSILFAEVPCRPGHSRCQGFL